MAKKVEGDGIERYLGLWRVAPLGFALNSLSQARQRTLKKSSEDYIQLSLCLKKPNMSLIRKGSKPKQHRTNLICWKQSTVDIIFT